MEKYYFQTQTKERSDWDTIPPTSGEFSKREDACTFARNLAVTQGSEVRMTDNEKLLQGSYFSPNGKI